VGAAFDRLMAIEPDQVNGRLLLLHGPPGTGKTTVLRALARAWQKWCRLDCVLDPERLLGESSYLMAAALGHDDDQTDRWRLLLLEDCDELIRADAKRGSGQSLSRLLNLTDGMLGQGLEVIVGITTNEPLTKLHPAIVRPGRCLAHIEVGRFNRLEAIDWLGRPATIEADGVTLAELFTLRGELTTVETRAPAERVGLYL
jgi:ATP-dependent 26S proteasome regulatory subunit